jgi:hypothetical protein
MTELPILTMIFLGLTLFINGATIGLAAIVFIDRFLFDGADESFSLGLDLVYAAARVTTVPFLITVVCYIFGI